jgi:hypothetical protein
VWKRATGGRADTRSRVVGEHGACDGGGSEEVVKVAIDADGVDWSGDAVFEDEDEDPGYGESSSNRS